MLQNNNILLLFQAFGQVDNKLNKYFSSFASQKYPPKLPLSIVPILDYSTINVRSISDVKRKQVKTNGIEANKRDVRQVTLLDKLKYQSLALEELIKNIIYLVLISNFNTC